MIFIEERPDFGRVGEPGVQALGEKATALLGGFYDGAGQSRGVLVGKLALVQPPDYLVEPGNVIEAATRDVRVEHAQLAPGHEPVPEFS